MQVNPIQPNHQQSFKALYMPAEAKMIKKVGVLAAACAEKIRKPLSKSEMACVFDIHILPKAETLNLAKRGFDIIVTEPKPKHFKTADEIKLNFKYTSAEVELGDNKGKNLSKVIMETVQNLCADYVNFH